MGGGGSEFEPTKVFLTGRPALFSHPQYASRPNRMGRPRTPSNVLELKGAFAKNPARGRERENEMEPVGNVGEPLEWLSESEVVCWHELRESVPDGCLARSDRHHLAYVSRLYAFIKETPVSETPPAVMARFMAGLGQMGMNPSERSKVKIGKGPAKNPFDDI